MKIIITPESEDEEKQIGKSIEFNDVFEFAITGRYILNKLYEKQFSHMHVNDKYYLIGKLHELLSRLNNGYTVTR